MAQYAHMDSYRRAKAVMLTGDNVTVISVWANAVPVEEIDPFDNDSRSPGLNVLCGNEVKRASLGDYVIQHEDGTFDVSKPLSFLSHYVKLGN